MTNISELACQVAVSDEGPPCRGCGRGTPGRHRGSWCQRHWADGIYPSMKAANPKVDMCIHGPARFAGRGVA